MAPEVKNIRDINRSYRISKFEGLWISAYKQVASYFGKDLSGSSYQVCLIAKLGGKIVLNYPSEFWLLEENPERMRHPRTPRSSPAIKQPSSEEDAYCGYSGHAGKID